jgi:cell division septum initiation protein DivIVA
MSERRDVQSSLADMDRKLRELQRELAMVSQRPEPAPASAPTPTPPVEPPPVEPLRTSFAPEPEPPAPQPPPEPQAHPPDPPPVDPSYFRDLPSPQPAAAPTLPPVAAAHDQAEAILAGARAEAARVVQEAAGRVAAISRQIDELQHRRDEVERSARALVDEYARAMRQLAEPTSAVAPRFPEPEAPTPAAAAPAPVQAPVAAPPPPRFQSAPLAPAAPPPAPAPAPYPAGEEPVPPPAPAGPPPAAAAPGAAGDNRFEGQVVINAGPFTDIATLGTFEQALARLPQAEDVYVRGFEGNRALIDLKLAGSVALLDEMRRSLPFGFGVVEVGRGTLTINVDSPVTGAP